MRRAPILLLQILLTLYHVVTVNSQSPPPNSADFLHGYEWGLQGPYPQQFYRSFRLGSPFAYVVHQDEKCDTGYTFFSPRGSKVFAPGPLIIDSKGELVWREARYGQSTDLKVQQYRGESYLTFWTGTDTGTFGNGSYVMLDSSYQLYKRITPVGYPGGDLHEFKITSNGTAMMTIYHPIQADLSMFGVPGQGWIFDSIFQEIDLDTRELIFEWRASEHFEIRDTFHSIAAEERRQDASGKPITNVGRSPEIGWDYFHINSIDKDEKTGNYYISSRYYHTVACISPNGDVLWRLGGKKNDFKDLSDGAATNFSFQHQAIMHENNMLSLFDNGLYDRWAKNAEYSRGMVISLDLDRMTATLVQEYIHPDHRLLASQGSMQILSPSGHALIGWGHAPAYTEFDNEGNILCDVEFVPAMFWNTGWTKNYRIFRTSDWVGTPVTQPDVYLRPRDGRVYVSWNGATEVETWTLQGLEDESKGYFSDLSSTRKERFEESIAITDDMPPFLRVAAVHRNGTILSYTEVLDRRVGNAPPDPPSPVVMVWQMISVIAFPVLAVFLVFCLWKMRRLIFAAAAAAVAAVVLRLRHRRSSGRTRRELLDEAEARKPLRTDTDEEGRKDEDYEMDERELSVFNKARRRS
ncbi:hypothetical protein H2200_002270 [Cladophialophora chaetospira]|uniref:ASST-domain-containing protein n=1 Tax=Cladophialophora chaetospira TaxID=386627 RepID=A0AA38XIN7_9EURO|nr:hypothetical protein H2200_002270 [Cladophialophora chaetospira]